MDRAAVLPRHGRERGGSHNPGRVGVAPTRPAQHSPGEDGLATSSPAHVATCFAGFTRAPTGEGESDQEPAQARVSVPGLSRVRALADPAAEQRSSKAVVQHPRRLVGHRRRRQDSNRTGGDGRTPSWPEETGELQETPRAHARPGRAGPIGRAFRARSSSGRAVTRRGHGTCWPTGCGQLSSSRRPAGHGRPEGLLAAPLARHPWRHRGRARAVRAGRAGGWSAGSAGERACARAHTRAEDSRGQD